MRKFVLLFLVLLLASQALAFPMLLPVQGKLKGSDAGDVNKQLPMTFALYSVASGGSAIWSITKNVDVNIVDVNNNIGVFTTLLGENALLDINADTDFNYVGITIQNNSEMTPRVRLGSTAYAYYAWRALGIASGIDANFDSVTATNFFGDGSGLTGLASADTFDTTLDNNATAQAWYWTYMRPDTTLDSNGAADLNWLATNHLFSVDQNFVNIGMSGGFAGLNAIGDSNFVNVGISGNSFLTNFAFYNKDHEEFEYGHTLVDKEYVDKKVAAINTSYYLYDTASGLGDYKLTSITSSSDAETSVTDAGLPDGNYIQGWISPTDANLATLVAGIYELHITREKSAGTKTLQLYWLLVERRANGTETIIATSETGKIVTSKEAEEIHLSLTTNHDINSDSRIIGKIHAKVTGAGTAPTSVLYYRGETVSAWNVPTSTEVLTDIFYTKTDVNAMFVPYVSGVYDVNLGIYAIKAFGDSNFHSLGISNALFVNGDINVTGSVSATGFFGDGSGLTGLASADAFDTTLDNNATAQAWYWTYMRPDTTLDNNALAQARFWEFVDEFMPIQDSNLWRYIPNEADIDLNAMDWDTNANTVCDGNTVLTGDGICLGVTGFDIQGAGSDVVDTTLDTNGIADLNWLGNNHLFTGTDNNFVNIGMSGGFAGFNAIGDSNFVSLGVSSGGYFGADVNVIGSVQATGFFGDGSGLTDVTSTGDVNDTAISPNYVTTDDVDLNNVSVKTRVDVASGSEGNPSIAFTTNTGTGLWSNAGQTIGFSMDSVEYFRVSDTVNAEAHALSNFRVEQNAWIEADLNVAADSNLFSVTAHQFFGDGSGLSNVSATGGLPDSTCDSNLGCQDWLFGLSDQNFAVVSDFNSRYHSVFDLNAFYYKQSDVNTHFVPYIGATKDVNIGTNAITAGIDSNIGSSTAFWQYTTKTFAGTPLPMLQPHSAIGNYGAIEGGLSLVEPNGIGSITIGLYDYGTTGYWILEYLTDTERLSLYSDTAGRPFFITANTANIGDFNVTGDVNITGDINVTGSVEATAFFGDGSDLTGVSATGGLPDSTLDTNGVADLNWLGNNHIFTGIQQFQEDVNITSGLNTGISIDPDFNKICFPSNSCEMSIDFNGTAFIFGA